MPPQLFTTYVGTSTRGVVYSFTLEHQRAEDLQNLSEAYRTVTTTRDSSSLGRRVVARRRCREILYEGRVAIERSQSVASTT